MSDLRMPEINTITIAGRLTRDPELRHTKGSTAILNFSVAVSHHYKAKTGARLEDTTYVNVTAWDKQAEYLGSRLRKGAPVLVEGSLESSEWETQAGEKRNKLQVRARRVHQLEWDDAGASAPKQETAAAVVDNSAAGDDEVPF